MNVSSTTPMPLTPDEKVGHYTVVQAIASGGSAAVYRAHDSLLNQSVAIKQLLPAQDDAPFRERFRSEAAIQRRVSECHPGVVKLIDAIENDRGAFLVMEYVHGYTLEQLLMRTGQPIDATQTLRVIWSAAKALQAIHDQGVLHRDLKPSNILVQQASPQKPQPDWAVKLVDLGVASLIAEQEAMSLGSVRYMAPELFQMSSGGGAVDGRCDVYALGMIFYEMLVGRTAFQEAFKQIFRDQRNQAMRWMKWHTNLRLTAPPVHELNPAVPPHLSELVARTLAKDPVDRIPTAGEMADAIERHFTARGVSDNIGQRQDDQRAAAVGTMAVRSAGDTAKFATPVKKDNKKLILLGSVVAAMLVAVIVIVLLTSGGDPEAEQRLAVARQQVDDARTAMNQTQLAQADALLTQAMAVLPPDDPKHAEAALLRALWQVRAGLDTADYEQARAGLAAMSRLSSAPGYDATVHDQLRTQVESRAAFDDTMREAEAAFAENDRYTTAQILNTIDPLRLTAAERERFDSLRERLSRMMQQDALRDALAQVETRLNAPDRTLAVASINRLRAEFQDPVFERLLTLMDWEENYIHAKARALGTPLPGDPEAGQAPAVAIQEALDAIDRFQRADDAQTLPHHNPSASDTLTAAAAPTLHRDAMQDDARAALQDVLRQRLIDAAVARAQANLDIDPVLARQAALDALSLGDSDQARAILAQLDASATYDDLVRQGDEALFAQDYQQAADYFQRAIALRPDDLNVSNKLRQARVAQAMAQARQAEGDGDPEATVRAYERVLAVDPRNEAARAALDRAERSSAYFGHLRDARQAMDEERFGDALLAYLAAKQLNDTATVNQGIQQAEVSRAVALARQRLEENNLSAAKAQIDFAIARVGRDADPEIVALAREIRERIAREGGL